MSKDFIFYAVNCKIYSTFQYKYMKAKSKGRIRRWRQIDPDYIDYAKFNLLKVLLLLSKTT